MRNEFSVFYTSYQNLTYKAIRIISVMMIRITVLGVSLNISLSRAKAFALTFGPPRLIPTTDNPW